MTVFLVEWAFTLAALLVLALAGGFVLPAFRQGRRFVVLLAPMCGLLVLPIVTTFIYTFGKASFSRAAIIAILIASALSIATSIRWRPSHEDVCWSLLLITILSAVAAALSMSSSIYNGSPSLLFIDGSDHAGYAHAADWLLNHRVHERPTLSPDAPYESWPYFMFSSDPRLSGLVVNALVAWARGLPGLFAYDAGCTVVFAAAVLGVACVFSRTPRTLVLLSVGLTICAWFDLGRSGYFGKLAGYPATLFVFGLLLTNANRDVKFVAAAMLLTVGAATLHSAFATALLVGVVGCTYVVAAGAIELIDKRQAKARRLTRYIRDGYSDRLCKLRHVRSPGHCSSRYSIPPFMDLDIAARHRPSESCGGRRPGVVVLVHRHADARDCASFGDCDCRRGSS